MKEVGKGLKAIWAEDKRLMALMILMVIFALALVIFSLVTLNPANSVTKIGYGDIGGYRDGAWTNMLSWPLLALVFAVMNGLVAVKLWQKNGGGMARMWVGTTILLVLIGFVVLTRLLGES